MSQSANVRSLEALRMLRAGLLRFADEAASARDVLRQELLRVLAWIDDECGTYWQAEGRKGFDAVAEARVQLARKQIQPAGFHKPSCIDEQVALQKARRRLEYALAQQKTVRQWSVKLHRAADLFSTRLSRLESLLNQDVPKGVAHLDRMITALEAYAGVKSARPEQGEEVVGASTEHASAERSER